MTRSAETAVRTSLSAEAGTPIEQLDIILYPDRRLRAPCRPVESFDEDLRRLAERMVELMTKQNGVGLAAPQVGINIRMFVCNHTTEPEDTRVYVNPVLSDLVGSVEGDEGCLSIPNVTVPVRRAQRCVLRGFDLTGQALEVAGEDLEARVWQHETDHLDGVLILDKMSPASKIAGRRPLKQLEDDFRAANR